MEAKTVHRMRTVTKIVAEIRAMDPSSGVSQHYVRQLVKSGIVPVVWAGTKALINLDDVLEVLRKGTARPEAKAAPVVAGIRRIEVMPRCMVQ